MGRKEGAENRLPWHVAVKEVLRDDVQGKADMGRAESRRESYGRAIHPAPWEICLLCQIIPSSGRGCIVVFWTSAILVPALSAHGRRCGLRRAI
ncbi:hypothetical protein Micbo1qcDRAFT_163462, partial [Microdochium bolleyi]